MALKSVGCRTNQEEITVLGFELAAHGHAVVDDVAKADVVVINTCSVTACSEAKTRRLIRSLARQAPGARLLVTGCLAQQRGEQLAGEPGVHWVVGNGSKQRIASLVDHPPGLFLGDPDTPVRGSVTVPDPVTTLRTRFPLKIQEGCDFSCAYCIVPSLRGRSRSLPVEEALEACTKAASAGLREIVLSGTHIGQYRVPEVPDGLAGLLDRILAAPADFRVRLSSLDPRELTPALVQRLASDPRVCPHLHLSVQSLSAAVLARMNRAATDLRAAARAVAAIRSGRPDLCLGGDFIVGFPDETEEEFRETLERVGEWGFAYGHVFRYSRRPGTSAVSLDGQVAEVVKSGRSEALREVLSGARACFARGQVGRTHRIVVERGRPVTGVTGNYLRVEVAGTHARRNAWLDVTIDRFDPERRRCLGHRAEEADA